MTCAAACALPFFKGEKISQEKERAVKTVVKEAKEYNSKLANNSFLILYKDSVTSRYEYIEVLFLPENFQHLTGLDLIDDDGNIIPNCSKTFYDKCVNSRLSANEISIKDNHTTGLKLLALPYITQITKITKMAGKYNHTMPNLEADYLIGGTSACIGVDKYPNSNMFFPRTCLKADIRKYSTYTSQVLAIFAAPYPPDGGRYKEIRYVQKGLPLNKLDLPKEIKGRISLEDYIPSKNVGTSNPSFSVSNDSQNSESVSFSQNQQYVEKISYDEESCEKDFGDEYGDR